MLVETEVCDQLLELAVLLLEQLQSAQLADAEPGVQRLPPVESLLRNPYRRMTSATDVPVSACLSAYDICSSVYLLFFTACSSSRWSPCAKTLTQTGGRKRGDVNDGLCP